MAAGDRVWGVTMVKDEVDILSYTLAHLLSERLDGFAIIDNDSSDGTSVIIAMFQRDCEEAGVSFDLVLDDEVAYYQSRKMTSLAENAWRERGADWIVPFDADEIWYCDDQPLGDYLRSLPSEVDCVQARLFNHFPTSGDSSISSPVQRICHRDPDPAPLPKVALRWREGMVIHQGNHGVDGATERIDGPVVVRHFPWRSFNQFKKKARNGAAAYAAADLPEEMGSHWRGYGRILEEHGEAALRTEVWDQWFYDPPLELVHDPAPYLRWGPR